MFGFEDNKENQQELGYFGFDLEDQIAKNKTYPQKISKQIDQRILKIKDLLRVGGTKKDFDQLAIILNGYISMQKVLHRIEAQQMLKKHQPKKRR